MLRVYQTMSNCTSLFMVFNKASLPVFRSEAPINRVKKNDFLGMIIILPHDFDCSSVATMQINRFEIFVYT